ncbi:MAG: hypothetical protein JWR51_2506 [Devosia sp.]|uniref:hypothetical protein n=1 Tax=Devosia sp. TaxID=1871048 RepID=UPI0026168C9C|nr:hypothetical protein [Devosia sp.]MDB5529403.1 hypothetical protein [Devosia sp.]
MNVYHKWSKTQTKPFPGESDAELRQRTAEIDAIIEGFRWGRFTSAEAEAMDKRLQSLQQPPQTGRRQVSGSY